MARPSAWIKTFAGLRARCTLPAPSADERHREIRDSIGQLEVIDRKDVRVIELGERLGLCLEALDEAVVLEELRGQGFERHLAAQRLLDGSIDDGHPAPAETLDDPVLADPGPR